MRPRKTNRFLSPARTDRILPNGVCLLPPLKRCERGNACLTCDHFATDARPEQTLNRVMEFTGPGVSTLSMIWAGW